MFQSGRVSFNLNEDAGLPMVQLKPNHIQSFPSVPMGLGAGKTSRWQEVVASETKDMQITPYGVFKYCTFKKKQKTQT